VWWGVTETDEIRQLDLVLADREVRNELVMDLLAAHSDFVLPLRFIAAYNDYRCTSDRKERQMKGRKLLSTFFQPGSMFQLRSIPDEDLTQVRTEHLGMVKNYFLSEMVKMQLISDYISKFVMLLPENSSTSLTTSEGSG
jgi:hypothetical protein